MDPIATTARPDSTPPGTPRVAGAESVPTDGGRRDFARRLARRTRQSRGADRDADDIYEPDSEIPQDPTQPLMEALERMRITGDTHPRDPETGRILRGLRAYQRQTTGIVIPA